MRSCNYSGEELLLRQFLELIGSPLCGGKGDRGTRVVLRNSRVYRRLYDLSNRTFPDDSIELRIFLCVCVSRLAEDYITFGIKLVNRFNKLTRIIEALCGR